MADSEPEIRLKEIGLVVDGMKHLSVVSTGLSAIIIAFLDHMRGWEMYIGRYVLSGLFASICLSLLAILFSVYKASRENKKAGMMALLPATLAVVFFAVSVALLIPVAWDIVQIQKG